ncbi:MAG TPA: AI-2E family transporter [Candidatus Peribacteraceae bacterium]|nr:AI-2E family transporter [Candidatus Peribacteraceae bacterium]
MTPKKNTAHFTSFRILGKKAQGLLQKAAELKRRQAKSTAEEKIIEAESPENDLVIRFSPLSVAQATFIILAVLAGVLLIVVLKDKLILMGLGFFVAAIIDPGVRAMERMGFPRGIGVLIHYFLALFIFLFLVVSLIPIIAYQLQQIAILINDSVNEFLNNPQISLPLLTPETNHNLTEFVHATLQNLSITRFTDALQSLSTNMTSLAQGSFFYATKVAGSVLDFIVSMVIVLVLAFFIQIEREHLRSWTRSFFPTKYRSYIDAKTEAIQQKISQWARGQLLLGLSVGLLVFVALNILRIPYATTLGILAGFTEFIPYIGPFIAAVPAILIALTSGGIIWALIVCGVYYVVQWCENNLLVPLIMKRAVGLSPIAIIFAMLTALSFPDVIHPILGLLLAVPVTTIITLFLDDFRRSKPQYDR